MEFINLALFLVEAVFYFSVMTCFLHFRNKLGLGVFLTALGVMHFMETYLAAVFYIQLPFGVASPGSSILFAGKLMMILMLYMKEDAAIVRQPIYGLFLGNLLTVAIAQLVKFHHVSTLTPGQPINTGFLDEMGILMVWGTAFLYLDSIGIILLYEKLGTFLRKRIVLRFAICGAVILTFDQAGFYAGLYYLYDAPAQVFFDGWQAKLLAVGLYTMMFAVYQNVTTTRAFSSNNRNVGDVFNDLTFRERYEDLLSRSGVDVLTGVPDRARMEAEIPKALDASLRDDTPASLLIIDIDRFKSINDSFGHLKGDEVLKAVAAVLSRKTEAFGRLYRFGGEEFVIFLPSTNHDKAMAFARSVQSSFYEGVRRPDGTLLTLSIGVATSQEDGLSFNTLLAQADVRLYEAKNNGRDQVRGRYEVLQD